MKKKAVFLDRDGTINVDVGYPSSFDQIRVYPYAFEAVRKLNEAGFLAVIVTNQSGVGRGFFTEDALRDLHDRLLASFTRRGVRVDAIYYCPHYDPASPPECQLGGEDPFQRAPEIPGGSASPSPPSYAPHRTVYDQEGDSPLEPSRAALHVKPRGIFAARQHSCFCRKPNPEMGRRAAADLDLDLRASYMIGDKVEDIEFGWNIGATPVLVRTGFGAAAERLLLDRPHRPAAVADTLLDAVDWILRREKNGP